MMEYALLLIAAVLVIVTASYFAPKLGIATPVLLVLVGIGCSYIPGAPEVLVEPEWILMVVLPPILYSAAVNMPVMDFRRNLGPISALSVLLVIASAFATGLLVWWLMPDIGFAAAVALGAVISPPDAVAAISVGKRLGLPNRLVTIMEGEGLFNDATALVMLRTAVAATAGTVTFWGALGDFAYAVAVGIAVGAVIGMLSVMVRSRIRNQPVLTTAISLIVPFVSFIPAEELHASGVIAVVVTGLITGHASAKRFSASDRITERTNWRTIQLLLENGVFLLMGFEITAIVGGAEVAGSSVIASVGIGLLATLVLLVVRSGFIVPLIAVQRHGQRRALDRSEQINARLKDIASRDFGEDAQDRVDRVTQMLQRRQADSKFLASEGLGWRGGAVLAWSGMRGVVTLAAAQSLPTTIPHRAELILIAFTVAIATLLLHGGTLPALIKALGIRGDDRNRRDRERARLAVELADAARAVLDSPVLRREDGALFDPVVIDRARKRVAVTSLAIEKLHPKNDGNDQYSQTVELQRLLVDTEHAALLDARASGTYSSQTLQQAQQIIDVEAMRLEGRDGSH